MGFEPSRKTQRFCSTRCADRQRDRRRQNRTQTKFLRGKENSSAESPTAPEAERATESTPEQRDTRQQVHATTKRCQKTIDALTTKLRAQSSDLDRLEAENTEQQVRVHLLQGEVARLKRAQRINVQDLAHVAARIVALAQAKGLPLDSTTRDILRRRGWIPSRRPAGVRRL